MVDCTRARDFKKTERGLRAVRALGTGRVIFVLLFKSSRSPGNMLTLCASLRSLPLFTYKTSIKLLVYRSLIIHNHTGLPSPQSKRTCERYTLHTLYLLKVPKSHHGLFILETNPQTSFQLFHRKTADSFLHAHQVRSKSSA